LLLQNKWESNLEVLIVQGSTENTKMELKQSVKLTAGFISLGTWTGREFSWTCQQFVGATYFDSRVVQWMCVCVCVCFFDVVSLSTRDINQVSVAISLTLKVEYLRTLSIRRKRHVLWSRFQRDGMVQNPLKHFMRWFPWEITIVSNSLSMHEVRKEGKWPFVPTEPLQWRSHSRNLQNISLSTGLSTHTSIGLKALHSDWKSGSIKPTQQKIY